jgi:hypothetical protein
VAAAGFVDKAAECRVARPQQVALLGEGVFRFAGESKPSVSRSGLKSPSEQMVFWRGPKGV